MAGQGVCLSSLPASEMVLPVHIKVMNPHGCYSETIIDSFFKLLFWKTALQGINRVSKPFLQVQVHFFFLKSVFKSMECVECLSL